VDGRGTNLPGAIVGIVGGGQLGRMLAAVAQRNGYHVSVLAPEAAPPAAVLADHHQRAAYDDAAAVRDFAATVDVLTFEFENVSSAALEAAASVTTVRPAPSTLYTTQNRAREKAFLASEGLATAPYVLVSEASELQAAITEVGPRCLVKT